jgi:hypothetical protein
MTPLWTLRGDPLRVARASTGHARDVASDLDPIVVEVLEGEPVTQACGGELLSDGVSAAPNGLEPAFHGELEVEDTLPAPAFQEPPGDDVRHPVGTVHDVADHPVHGARGAEAEAVRAHVSDEPRSRDIPAQ